MPRRITGTVDQTSSGMFRARIPTPEGKRQLVGVYPTRDLAWEACAVAIGALGLDGSDRGVTFAAFAKRPGGFLERRKKARAWKNTETLWATYIETAPWYQRPMRAISHTDIEKWVTKIRDTRARQTTLNALYVASSCFGAAKSARLIKVNPCAEVKVAKETRTEDVWTFLGRDEPALVESACTPDEWHMIAFAWGTGLRAGEQRSLLLRDVHVAGEYPHVMVRYGSPGKPTKNGKPREVPLFGVALDAARSWLMRLPSYVSSNPRGLMFPTPSGKHRAHSHFLGTVSIKVDDKWKAADRWTMIVEEAGLGRRFRWHDLRHSCASWAISGWFGNHKWSLVEVQKLLGHHSTTITERYAHLAGTALREAARQSTSSSLLVDKSAAPRRRSGSGNKRESHDRSGILVLDDDDGTLVGRYVAAVAKRDRVTAWREARAFAGAVAVINAKVATLVAEVLGGGPRTHRAMAELLRMVRFDAEQREEQSA